MPEAETSLAIRRLRLDCLVERGARRPAEFESRILRIAREELPSALRARLGSALAQGGGLLFLRSLNIELVVDEDVSARRVAESWSALMQEQILRSLVRPPGSSGVVFFESPSAYLAHYVTDVARGIAAERWYYANYAGLSVLPPSQAIRTALLREPEEGMRALRGLRRDDLEAVVSCLEEPDAARISDAWTQEETSPDHGGPTLDRLLPALARSAESIARLPQAETARAVLVLCTDASGEAAQRPLHRPTLLAVARLLELARAAPEDADAVLAGHTRGSPHARELPSGASAALAPLASLPHRARAHLRATIRRAVEDPAVTPARTSTSYGGVFLLLPSLVALPLSRMTLAWPQLAGQAADRVLRWLVLSLAEGGSRLADVATDSLPARLCGLGGGAALRAVLADLAFVDPDLIAGARSVLYDALRGEASGAPVELVLSLPGGVVQLAKDGARGHWLRLEAGAAGAVPGPASGTEPDADDLQDLLPASLALLPWETRLLLAQLAQIIVKRFAYRLPGFAGASNRYLRANFLCMRASVSEEEHQIVVALGRAPLSVLLNMTGASRQSYVAEAFDSRPIHLHQAP